MKTVLLLPNSTEIASGKTGDTSILSCKITEAVNGGQELTLGSACAAMAEIRILLADRQVLLTAGDELTLYREQNGIRRKIGLFTCETVKRNGRNLQVTAYDRISWLDRDVSVWLSSLDGWPYNLLTLAQMVCRQCGLQLQNRQIPNGSYRVRKFSLSGVKGRQILQWVGQVCGRYCRATPEGGILLDWYTPASMEIGPRRYEEEILAEYCNGSLIVESPGAIPRYENGHVILHTDHLKTVFADGNLTVEPLQREEKIPYFMGKFSHEDYEVQKIGKVQIRFSDKDVGTVWPDTQEPVNTYRITGNYLLTGCSPQELQPVAQALYDQLKDLTYTPCRVTVPTNFRIHAGHTVQIRDLDGRNYKAYVMKKIQTGDRDTLECTGSRCRDSVTAVNNRQFGEINGKILNLTTDMDGIRAEVMGVDNRVTLVDVKADGISLQVEKSSQKAADDLKNFSDQVTKNIAGIQEQIDGQIQSYFDSYVPMLSNEPAVSWKTENEKANHLGDLFYIVGDVPDSGKTYRWVKVKGVYGWELLVDSDISKALDAASKAQATADGKMRVFLVTPTTPYDKGDLWSRGTSGELMVCKTERRSGAYAASDWMPATNTGSEFKVLSEEISAKVSHHGGDDASFAYELNPKGFYLKANGKLILAASANGLGINGKVTAVSGAIGGMDIAGGALTTNMATYENGKGGIYLGPKGLNVQEKFYVNAMSGKMTAKDAEIHGDIYAENGYFHGTVRAGKIEYGSSAGYVSGSALSSTSVSNGKLTSAVSDNIAKGVKANDVVNGRSTALSMACNDFSASVFHIAGHQVVRIPARLKNPITGQYEDYMILATHGST